VASEFRAHDASLGNDDWLVGWLVELLVGRDAFDHCKSLKSIKIIDSITTIGRSAFRWYGWFLLINKMKKNNFNKSNVLILYELFLCRRCPFFLS